MDASLSEWDKFTLLLWKNWRSHWNHRKHFIMAITSPALFASVLIFIRFQVDCLNLTTATYSPIHLDYAWQRTLGRIKNDTTHMKKYDKYFDNNYFLPKITIAYAPNDQEFIENLMKKVGEKLTDVPLKGYRTEKKLIQDMKNNYFFAGVFFPSNNDLFKNPPNNKDNTDFEFKLIFPGELRYYDDTFIGSDWSTESLYDHFAPHEQRFPNNNNGGYVGYLREGFLMLQNLISLAFIEQFTGYTEYPPIRVQRFPYKSHTQDLLTERMEEYLAFIILAGFLYPCMFITWSLSRERSTAMKEVIKIYGINYFVQFCAWFFYGVLIFLLATILVVTLLKIQWQDDLGIITKCSWFALVLFLTSYSIASISFCFMINSFCSHTQSAIIMLGLLWILTFLPYIVKVNQHIEDKWLFSIVQHSFSNTAMGSAFVLILEYEQFSEGFKLNNFFNSQNYGDKITVGLTTLILCVQCILYTVIGIYVDKINPGSYGIASSWNYLFVKPDQRRLSDRKRSSPIRQTKVFEVEPQYKKVNVQIERLCKAYNNEMVISDIHMNFFENEIFVIMGHNGCGKTTLFMMLVGLLKPTSGKISIYGFDVDKNREIAHSYIGMCLQENIILYDLSVSEQLKFYCRIKGMSDSHEIDKEIMYYLKAVELSEYIHVYTRQLSAGHMRLLSVCCALCAHSQVVVLDMPSVGMDLSTRKILWRLLLKEKKHCTIVLTTHCAFEAELLADRMAMMSGGELKCMGTTHFLKNMYGMGNRLVCSRGDNCEIDKLSSVIHEVLPTAKLESTIGTECTYRLKKDNSQSFPKLLQTLEENSDELDLNGFYITNNTIEDIYLSMGSADPSEGEAERHAEIMNGKSSLLDDYDDLEFLKPYTPQTGITLCCYHWKALLYKRFLYIFRSRTLWIQLILFPVLVIALAFFISQYNFEADNPPPMTYRFANYTDTTTPILYNGAEDDETENVVKKYEKIITWNGVTHKTTMVTENSMDGYILERQKSDTDEHTYKKYIIGASFDEKEYIAWFNNFALHSAPLSMNVLHNAMLSARSEHSTIRVTLDPLPFNNIYHAKDMRDSSSTSNFLAAALSYCIVFEYSFTLMYIIRERQSRFKLIQQISGMRPLTFWMTTFIYDLSIITAATLLFMLIIYFYELISLLNYNLAFDFGLIMFIFGVTVMPFNYLMSEFFDDYILGYFVTITIYVFGDISLAAVIDGIEQDEGQDDIHLSKLLERLFCINPYFALSRALFKAYNVGKHQHLCSTEAISTLSVGLGKCHVHPNCCVDYKTLSWEEFGILPEVVSFFIVSIICIIIIIIKVVFRLTSDYRTPDPEMGLAKQRTSNLGSVILSEIRLSDPAATSAHLFAEHADERTRMLALTKSQFEQMPLVLDNFTKRYRHIKAAEKLNLIIEHNDVVCLIGQNGDGKTAILKVLTGEEIITSGNAYVQGIDVNSNLSKAYKHIGYCPENATYLDQFTLYEVMKILSMLRGVPEYLIEHRCETLSKLLGFFEDFDRRYGEVSYGNRRRLSLAIAFLGDPTMIFLDSPFKCIDPSGVRQQWNLFGIVRNAGKSLLIASSRPRECSTISTRCVVLSHGVFTWLGTVHELKRLLPMDYLLKIKIKPFEDVEINTATAATSKRSFQSSVVATPYSKILLFVETEFPNAFLKEETGLTLYFQIPEEDTTLSEIYLKIDGSFVNIYIEDFVVSNTRLTVQLMDNVDHLSSEA